MSAIAHNRAACCTVVATLQHALELGPHREGSESACQLSAILGIGGHMLLLHEVLASDFSANSSNSEGDTSEGI